MNYVLLVINLCINRESHAPAGVLVFYIRKTSALIILGITVNLDLLNALMLHLQARIISGLLLFTVRPPCSTVNGLSVNLFLDEFSNLLEEVVLHF